MRPALPKSAVVAAIVCAVASLTLSAPHSALAQTNPTITNAVPESAAATIHAKIQAINPDTREVTLSGRSGNAVTVVVGPDVRLNLLKVGDTVNARYYRSVAFLVSRPGMAAPQDEIAQVIAQPVQVPGGAAVRLTQVSGAVVGIDLAANSVDLVNPSGGGIYTFRVTDPARQASLSTLKIGDTITVVISRALAVSIEPAAKSWF